MHLYSEDGDVLYARNELMAVHTIRGGPRRISLPHEVEVVYDLYERGVVAENTAGVEIDPPGRSTSLFYLGPRARLESLDSAASRD